MLGAMVLVRVIVYLHVITFVEMDVEILVHRAVRPVALIVAQLVHKLALQHVVLVVLDSAGIHAQEIAEQDALKLALAIVEQVHLEVAHLPVVTIHAQVAVAINAMGAMADAMVVVQMAALVIALLPALLNVKICVVDVAKTAPQDAPVVVKPDMVSKKAFEKLGMMPLKM
jgi:hypothetical protein